MANTCWPWCRYVRIRACFPKVMTGTSAMCAHFWPPLPTNAWDVAMVPTDASVPSESRLSWVSQTSRPHTTVEL